MSFPYLCSSFEFELRNYEITDTSDIRLDVMNRFSRNILELHKHKLRTRRGFNVIIRVRDVLKHIRNKTNQSNVDKILIVKVHETEVNCKYLAMENSPNTRKLKLVPVFERRNSK